MEGDCDETEGVRVREVDGGTGVDEEIMSVEMEMDVDTARKDRGNGEDVDE